jgi:hypothetical protein
MIRAFAPAFVLLALAVPATASAAAPIEFALQDDSVFVEQRFMDREQALDHATQLHTKRIRVNIQWARVLTTDAGDKHTPAGGPAYDFSRFDALQQAAAKRNIKLQLTLTGPAPAWATKDHKVSGTEPDPVKFAAFARTVTAHFKGRVDRYSIWNEPNLRSWLAPTNKAPQLYRGLYTAGYTAVKTVDPKAKVLFGEFAPYHDGRTIAPLKFLRDVTCVDKHYKRTKKHCTPLKADGLATHPYQFTKEPHKLTGSADDAPISRLDAVIGAVDKLAKAKALRTPKGSRLDLYMTEFGYLSVGSRKQTQTVRAAWLRTAFDIARRSGRVRQILQFQLVDGPPTDLWHSAVLDHKGKPQGAYAGLVKAIASVQR